AYASTYGMKTIAFRFFNVYGPLQAAGHPYAAVIPTFINAALRRNPLRVHGDGLQTRDFTFVDSVTRVLADAASRGVVSSSPINLAFGSRTTLLALVNELSQIFARKLEVRFDNARIGDVRDSQAATDRLKLLFPDSAPTPLRLGLERTVDWLSRT